MKSPLQVRLPANAARWSFLLERPLQEFDELYRVIWTVTSSPVSSAFLTNLMPRI
jgi:hypothetical protein